MIKKLVIKNFQSHKLSKVNFDKGVNVIIGKSDTGKTAILRALYWALFNRPGGEGFRSDWGGDTYSKIVFDDFCLKRIRAKGLNGYILNNDVENPHKGFGVNVPDDLAKLINMTKINFQQQLDGPFMLDKSWSPGVVGTFLNQITNLEIIDITQSNIKKTISHETKKIENIEENLVELKSNLKSYSDLNEMENDVKSVENIMNKLSILEDKECKLSDLIYSIEKSLEKIKELKPKVSIEKEIIKIETDYKDIEKTDDGHFNLYSLIRDIEESLEEVDIYQKKLYNAVTKFEELMPEECPLCGAETIEE